MQTTSWLLRLALFSALIASCIAKLWGGHQPEYVLSQTAFVAATLAEGVLAFGLLVPRLRTWSAVGIGAMAAVGISIAFWGQGRTCGCLGSMMRLTASQHVLVSATVGVLAVLVWHVEVAERRAWPSDPAR